MLSSDLKMMSWRSKPVHKTLSARKFCTSSCEKPSSFNIASVCSPSAGGELLKSGFVSLNFTGNPFLIISTILSRLGIHAIRVTSGAGGGAEVKIHHEPRILIAPEEASPDGIL